jgi:hypothetical protein
LERTLRSFFKFNTYPLAGFIVQDDSGVIGCNDHLKADFPSVTFRYNPERLGQIRSVDVAYADVATPYIFHLEEDWEFYRSGFIESSLSVMRLAGREICCVWIRAENDTNGHLIEAQVFGGTWSFVKTRHAGIWHGFTFNPSLRKKREWVLHGGYAALATFIPTRPWESEAKIGDWYMRYGYRAAILRGSGYVRHIGDNRGIRN